MNSILQYIKYPIAKLLANTFHPCKLEIDLNDLSTNTSALSAKYQIAKDMLDINLFLEEGDGPKFLGLLSAAEPTNDEYWNLLKKYWYKNYFVRNTKLDLIKTSDNFSGDQISGMLEAIWNRYNAVGLTVDELTQLKTIWDNTLFAKPYYKFKHPFTTNTDRGWLLSFWGLGNEVLALLAFLAVGFRIFNDEKYQKEYYKIYNNNKAVLNCVDICIWFGKIYGAAWYDEHSEMSLYCVGYQATNFGIFKDAATILAKRYKNNPEIQAYYLKYINDTIAYSNETLPLIKAILQSYDFDKKGSIDSSLVNTTKYFSIRSFTIEKMANKILLPNWRTGLYLWEEKDIKGVTNSTSKNATIDFIHLYSLIK